MSDYYHRKKMVGDTCPQCGEGTVKGDYDLVTCTNCTFRY